MFKKPTLRSLRRSRYLLFLSTLVFLLLGASFLRETLIHAVCFIALHALVMIAAVRIVSEQPRQWKVTLALAIPWLALALWGVTGKIPSGFRLTEESV